MNVATLIRILGAKGMSANDIADVVELTMPAEPTREERKRERDRARIEGKREAEKQSLQSRDTGDIARHDDTLSEGAQGSLPPTPPFPPNPPNLSQEPPIVPLAKPKKARSKGDFDGFWDAYPRKVGKGDARRAYDRALLKAGEDPAETIHAGLLRVIPFWDEPEYIPHPARWLNREGWWDQPEASESATGPPKIDLAKLDADRARIRAMYETEDHAA